MAYSSITKPSDYFNTKLYTGDNANNRQISLDFSPDFTWIKGRNAGYSHILFDRVRTNANYLVTNADQAEQDGSSSLGWTNTGCTTNSFTIDKGSNGSINNSGDTYVAWNWLGANGTASNSNGSITSTVSANTTAGFSIVKYTGNQTNGATVGHGLGAVPKMIIIKNLNDAEHWTVYHHKLPTGNQLYLNLTNGQNDDASEYYDTTPTSSVFTLGNSDRTNNVNIPYIAYCFAEKQGYSKFGSYKGNGNADGTFIYTGFKPAFFLLKRTDGAESWYLMDNKRDPFNLTSRQLFPNSSAAENNMTASNQVNGDILSNGFKIRATDTAVNADGGTYIYMAFAEEPLVANVGQSIPATAR